MGKLGLKNDLRLSGRLCLATSPGEVGRSSCIYSFFCKCKCIFETNYHQQSCRRNLLLSTRPFFKNYLKSLMHCLPAGLSGFFLSRPLEMRLLDSLLEVWFTCLIFFVFSTTRLKVNILDLCTNFVLVCAFPLIRGSYFLFNILLV